MHKPQIKSPPTGDTSTSVRDNNWSILNEEADKTVIRHFQGEPENKFVDVNTDQNSLSSDRSIILSGMSVHNLKDTHAARKSGQKLFDYVEPFNSLLTGILTGPSSEVLPQLKQLPINDEWKTLYKKSHPTNEHFLPAVIGAGISRGDECKELYSAAAGAVGWNIYRWGKTDQQGL